MLRGQRALHTTWFPLNWVSLSRPRDWVTSKLVFVGAVTLWSNPGELSLWVMLATMGTVAGWAAFGYGINEIADRRDDKKAGKNNVAEHLSSTSWFSFLVLSGMFSFGLSLVWASDLWAPGFVLAGLLVSAVYSLPPARLKERGFLGIIVGATAQWALPVLAVSGTQSRGWMGLGVFSLTLLALTIGIRWMAVHQLHDTKADERAGVRTFSTDGGSVETVIKGAFLCELGLLLIALMITWPVSKLATVALGLSVGKMLLLGVCGSSIKTKIIGYDHAPLAEYYFLLLPLSLTLNAGMANPSLLLLIPVFLALGFGQIVQTAREWREVRGHQNLLRS